MSNLDLPFRSLAAVITGTSVLLIMNIVSVIGNILVCLAMYRNPNLRSTTNLYIIALAVSDLICATVEMPLASAVFIIGKWDFGDALCQIQGFVDAFTTYVTPATMALTAFNRYMRIVKTNHYNRVFSPLRSKIWLSCVWLFLSLYLLVGRLTGWNKFQFIPGYAVCSIAFVKNENRIIHYFLMFGILFVLPLSVGCFSYCKVFSKIKQHQQNVASSLQNASNGTGRISAKEINISRALGYVAAGFLFCWIPPWVFAFWKRFSPDTSPRITELLVTIFLFMSATINPVIYATTNPHFRKEFVKLLCWCNGEKIQPTEGRSSDEQ